MSPLDLVLDRLVGHKLRENSPGRWRAICPVCGERNPNTLSIGEGSSGAVLLRCFKSECDAETIANALGLEITDLFPPRPTEPGAGARPTGRRRLISAHQALGLLADEANLVATAAANLAHGLELSDEDRDRLLTASARVVTLLEETRA